MTFIPRRTALMALGAMAAASIAGNALAQQQVALRLHQMLPAQATIPARALVPWAQKVEAESGGKIKVQLFNAMALGGAPPQLFDQARDGVVDLTWTCGYTPALQQVRSVRAAVHDGSAKSLRAPSRNTWRSRCRRIPARSSSLQCTRTARPFHTKTPVTGLESLRGNEGARRFARHQPNMLTKLGRPPRGQCRCPP